jgi:hypothetical protein
MNIFISKIHESVHFYLISTPMLRTILAGLIALVFSTGFAQQSLLEMTSSGTPTLSRDGASYFAQLSLNCTGNKSPHFIERYSNDSLQNPRPNDIWPSFYGCYDWHSAVHNHWALIKLLKTFPDIPEAGLIRARLEQSFAPENIRAELAFFKRIKEPASSIESEFEFPYGQSWLLKVADELIRWNDTTAQRWYSQLKPLSDYFAQRYIDVWPSINRPTYTGEHGTSSMGISFALDYARSSRNKKLEQEMIIKARQFYGHLKGYDLTKEPIGFDFMSKGLLVCDLMRKAYEPTEFHKWIRGYVPALFNVNTINDVLVIKEQEDHAGMEAHWDGFHLNRIWCLNGVLKSMAVPTNIIDAWRSKQLAMWNYAQQSIGKGNYDIDHWLSSFSVFALIGYE